MKADLVVCNPDTVRATATLGDPKQFPVGIDHVLVNGQLVVVNVAVGVPRKPRRGLGSRWHTWRGQGAKRP